MQQQCHVLQGNSPDLVDPNPNADEPREPPRLMRKLVQLLAMEEFVAFETLDMRHQDESDQPAN